MFGFQEIKIQQAQRIAGQQLVQGRRAILVAVHVSFVGRSRWFVVLPLLVCLIVVAVAFPLGGLFPLGGGVGLHAGDYFQVLGIKHVLRSAVFDFIAQRFGDPRGPQDSQSHFSQSTIARDQHFVGVLC